MFNFKQIKKKQKNSFKWKDLVYRFIALITVLISVSPTIVNASASYYLTFTYNNQLRGIMPGVQYSDVTKNVDEHYEIQSGGNYLFKEDGTQLFHVIKDGSGDKIGYGGRPPAIGDFGDSFFDEDRGNYDDGTENILPFSFPGRHVPTNWTNAGIWGGDRDSARNADSSDQEQAFWVGRTLTTGFNQVLSVIQSIEQGNNSQVSSLHSLAGTLATNAVKGTDFNVSNEAGTSKATVKISTISDAEYKDQPDHKYIDKGFYRKITVTGAGGIDNLIVPVAVNKGYGTSNKTKMYDLIRNTEYMDHADEDVYAINWVHMVMQAGHNAEKGVVATNAEDLGEQSRPEAMIVSMMGGLVSTLRGWLNLSTIDDLVFNKGVHGATHIYGTIPNTMGDVADYVFFLVMILSILILLGSFVSLLIKSNLSVINPQMRLDMKDSLFNIIVTFFLLVVFTPIWQSLLVINSQIVQYFFGMTTAVNEIGIGLVSGVGSLGAILLSIAFLIVEIWFNFYYIVRALTIMVLYMAAPLMIVSIAYGGRFKQVFENWLKEVMGAIFTQSIHAAILGAIFAGLEKGLGGTIMWQFVILISIIPLSNLFRKTILQLGGDSIGQTASSAEKGALAAGAIGGGLAMRGASALGRGASAVGGSVKANYKGLKGEGGGSPPELGDSTEPGGGGGNPSGTKLGDEVGDASRGSEIPSAPQASGNKELMKSDAQEHGKGVASLGEGVRATKEAVKATAKKGANLGKAVGHTVKDNWKEGAKGALKGTAKFGKDAAGGALTAGAMMGDVATDGGGSQALLAGKRMIGNQRDTGGKGRGGKSGGGSHSGSSSSEPKENLMNYARGYKGSNASKLRERQSAGQVGKNGELSNVSSKDGKQVLTSSNQAMSGKLGYDNIETHGENKEFENGSTSFDFQVEDEEYRKDLDAYADLSERRISGEELSDEENRLYDEMRENSGLAHLQSDGQGGYRATMDHKAMGWDGAETDGEFYVSKANANERKTLPSFNTAHDTSDTRSKYIANGAARARNLSSSSSSTQSTPEASTN